MIDIRSTYEEYKQRIISETEAKERKEHDQRVADERKVFEMSEEEFTSLSRVHKIYLEKSK